MIFLKSEPVRQIFKLNLSASFLMKLSSRFDNLLWCCRFHFPFCEYSISSLPFLHFSSFSSYTFCFYDIESSSKQKLYSTAMAIPAAVNKPNFKVIKTHTHTHTHTYIYTHTHTHTVQTPSYPCFYFRFWVSCCSPFLSQPEERFSLSQTLWERKRG